MKTSFRAFRSASLVSLLLLVILLIWQVNLPPTPNAMETKIPVALPLKADAAFGKLSAISEKRWTPAEQQQWVALARQRTSRLEELACTQPAVARAQMMSLTQLAALPEAIRRECEQPWNAVGDFILHWETSERPGGGIDCKHLHSVVVQGEELAAYGPHLRNARRTLTGEFLQGHRIGNVILLDDAVVRRLTSDEASAAETWFSAAASTLDPVTERDATDGISAVVGGAIYRFESEETLATFEATLIEAGKTARAQEILAMPTTYQFLASGGTHGNSGGITAETPYLDDDINALFIRVDFSDFAGEAKSISKAALETALSTVSSRINQYSYGAASLTYTVSNNLYRMPATGASYAVAGNNNGIRDAARALAAAHYTLANYDVVAVYFPSLSGVPSSQINYGGLASVGGGDHWLNGTSHLGVILHEFGHNYGLHHANFWNPEEDIGGTRYDDPDFSSLEYGDIFDVMGSGTSDTTKGYFNTYATSRLGWMPQSKVLTPTANGTFRIHRFDTPSATSQTTLALRVPMGGDVHYWVSFRKAFGAPSNLTNAAYVVAEGLVEDTPNLIDMTPNSSGNSTNDRNDCGLAVGAVLNDTSAGVRFQTMTTGGSAGSEWIDVNVQFTPRVEIAESAVEVDEDAGLARLTLKRYFGSAGAASVNYATANGSATSGADYHALSGTVTWAAGDVSDKVIAVPIRPDNLNEGVQTFTLTLSSPVGAVISAGKGTATVSILDPGRRFAGFSPGFFNITIDAIVPLADGKVIIGGDIYAGIGGVSSIRHIARLNADGSVDTSFLTGLGFNAPVTDMLLQPDGKIVVAGEFTSYDGTACNRLIRLNPNGTADTAFVSAYEAGPNAAVDVLALETSGKLLVAGDFTSFAGQTAKKIVRLLSTGARDAASPVNVDAALEVSWIDSVLALPDGKILIGGRLSSYQYVGGSVDGYRSGLARLLANGSRDATFEVGAGAHYTESRYATGDVVVLATQPDGKVLVGGWFTAWNGPAANYMVRLNSNGSRDGAFTAPAFEYSPQTILFQPSGAVVVGGFFASPVQALTRLASTGTVDTTWNPGGTPGGAIYALAQDSTGSIFVGGNFYTYAGLESRPVVRVAGGGGDSYDRWLSTRFSSAQITGGLAAPGADADADGAMNLLEMAVGTSPTSAASRPVPKFVTSVSSGSPSYLEIEFAKGPDAADLWIGAQFSTAMQTWSPASPTPGTNATYTVIDDSPTRLLVRDKTPISANANRFGRIVVNRPQ